MCERIFSPRVWHRREQRLRSFGGDGEDSGPGVARRGGQPIALGAEGESDHGAAVREGGGDVAFFLQGPDASAVGSPPGQASAIPTEGQDVDLPAGSYLIDRLEVGWRPEADPRIPLGNCEHAAFGMPRRGGPLRRRGGHLDQPALPAIPDQAPAGAGDHQEVFSVRGELKHLKAIPVLAEARDRERPVGKAHLPQPVGDFESDSALPAAGHRGRTAGLERTRAGPGSGRPHGPRWRRTLRTSLPIAAGRRAGPDRLHAWPALHFRRASPLIVAQPGLGMRRSVRRSNRGVATGHPESGPPARAGRRGPEDQALRGRNGPGGNGLMPQEPS